MNKPASYFSRLRRRKTLPKARDQGRALLDEPVPDVGQRSAPNSTSTAREPQLANEF